MFKHMSLVLKMGTGFGLVLLGVIALGAIGFFSMGSVQTNIADLYNTHVPLLESVSAIDSSVGDQNLAVAMFALHRDDSFLKDFEDAKQVADQNFAKTKKIISGDSDLVAEGWLSPIEKMRAEHDIYVKAGEAQIAAIQAGKSQAEVERLENRVKNEYSTLMGHIDEFKQKNKLEANRVSSLADTTANRTRLWLGGLALTMTFTGVAVAWLLTINISQPIRQATDEIAIGTDQIESAAGQVATASQALAEGASEQAASIEETSSSLEELSSMTRQNADNARQADSLMGEAKQVVGRANESMAKLIVSMKEISHASEETSKIIKTIDDIAFQTNLLALNASVEAARAGEAGAGFAVVAEEVRSLAMRAAEAARNTSELIEGSVGKIIEGDNLVQTTNDAFTEVAESSGKVAELVAEISTASSEQAKGIEQINLAVTEMDKVVQTNAASAEESASASEELSAQSVQINGIVAGLKGLITGRRTSNGALRPRSRRKKSPPAGFGPKLLAAHPLGEVSHGGSANPSGDDTF